MDTLLSYASNFMGEINLAFNQHEEARKYCLLAVLKNNKNYSALFNLGYIYQEHGNYEEAIKYYLDANENTDNIFTLNNLGSSYAALKDYEKAEIYFKQCNDILKNDYKKVTNLNMNLFVDNMIKIYKQNKKYDDVLNIYDEYNKKIEVDIDRIVKKILNNNIELDNKSINILKTFDFKDKSKYNNFHKLKIFKFICEIPQLYDLDAYVTFQIIKRDIMPYRKYGKVSKYIIIEITKWLFKN